MINVNKSNKFNKFRSIIALDKLFPMPPNNKYHNLKIDNESVTFITIPQDSNTISTIINTMIPDYIFRQDITIFDCTAGVGGDTISFGKIFGIVIATEINKKRSNMLINNLYTYNLYNVSVFNDDCVNVIKKINFIDIIYIDPPWGGKNYKYQNNLRLKISDYYIDEFINLIINKEISITKSDVKMIVLKLPKNYDIRDLYDRTKNITVQMYLYELKKMFIILYKSINYL